MNPGLFGAQEAARNAREVVSRCLDVDPDGMSAPAYGEEEGRNAMADGNRRQGIRVGQTEPWCPRRQMDNCGSAAEDGADEGRGCRGLGLTARPARLFGKRRGVDFDR